MIFPLRQLSLLTVALTGIASAAPKVPDGTDHWAFQLVETPSIPTLPSDTASTPIDVLHQNALTEQGLSMAAPASPQVIARRLAFHLHGLPASADEAESLANDPSPNAYQRHLDRLMASPRYGERWARHWMDVARYADNKGYVFQEERRYPYAYTYRDWLVSAFNRDLPYDDFIRQQIAGDHVAKSQEDPSAYAAMGFLTLGRRFLNREPDIIDDRIDVVTRGFLGLTVSCSRCHDHKFDPIPIEDYYSLYGVFASSEEPGEKPLLGKPDTASPAYQQFLKESAEKQAAIDEYFQVRHAKLRTEPILKAYFQLAHDGRDWDEPQIGKRAQAEKLYQKIALQWRDRLKQLGAENHPVFVPWKAFAESQSLPDKLAEKSNPVIWKALQKSPPQSMEELIGIYAKEIAASNQGEVHQDASREALRQLLVGEQAPTAP